MINLRSFSGPRVQYILSICTRKATSVAYLSCCTSFRGSCGCRDDAQVHVAAVIGQALMSSLSQFHCKFRVTGESKYHKYFSDLAVDCTIANHCYQHLYHRTQAFAAARAFAPCTSLHGSAACHCVCATLRQSALFLRRPVRCVSQNSRSATTDTFSHPSINLCSFSHTIITVAIQL